ncbi:MAG: TonB-dependent receptor [Pseudomonadota bacterium]
MKMYLFRTVSIAAVAFAATANALAQTGPQAADDENRGFDVIVVEAQRREEALIDVPISVSVIGGETITEARLADLRDLSPLTPNFNISSQASRTNPNFFMRGVGGIATVDPGSVQSVALFVDGVYIPFTSAALFDFVDVDRVEVIRGPQGTLFGRNATSGAVNIVTKAPDSEFGGNVEAEVGNLDAVRGVATVNIPFSGAGEGVRISGLWSKQDGFIDNALGDDLSAEETRSIRGRLSLAPVNDLEIDASLSYEEIRDSGYAYVLLADTFDRRYDTPLDSFDDRDIFSSSLRASYDFGPLSIVSTTAYQEYESDTANPQDVLFGFPAQDLGFTFSREVEEGDSWSQEVLAQSEEANIVDWTAGIFLSRTDVLIDSGAEFTPASGFPFGYAVFTTPTQNETDVAAVFADLTYNATDRLGLTFGGRYTHESLDWNTFSIIDGTVLAPTQFEDSADFSAFTPRVVLDYRFNDEFAGYASAARGFRAGGFTTFNAGGAPAAYDPEFVWTYEVGGKFQSADQQLFVSGAAFYNDWTDLQVFYLTTFNGLTQRLVSNAEGARSFGLEGEAQWTPSDRFEFGASLGWVNAKLTDVVNPLNGQSLEDNRVPLASEWTAGLSGQYRYPISANADFRFRTDVTYTGPYFFDTLNTQRQDAVTLLNLTAAVDTETWSFGVSVRNALDEDYYRWRFDSAGFDFGAAAEPLTMAAFLRAAF